MPSQPKNTAPGSPACSSAGRESSLKRRRVAKACQNCRLQKSKCDGRQPVCNRCEGYGHVCTWSEDKRNRLLDTSSPAAFMPDSPRSSFSTRGLSSTYVAIQSYEKLINSVRLDLPESARAAVDLTLSYIRLRLPAEVARPKAAHNSPGATESPPTTSLQTETTGRYANNQRYLGEASDVRFYHTIKKILQDGDMSNDAHENDIQSYDQATLHLERQDCHDIDVDLPAKDLADEYINIYFNTIHIAYPFICKLSFMELYDRYWKGDLEVSENSLWLPLMYTIFAIGAYYTSFPRSEDVELQLHLQYFKQAMSLSGSVISDCTLDNIHLLLALCFFSLATGQTDRCWNTLGLAIRIAQSIGLHVEDPVKQLVASLSATEQETMRRTWYSLYVLDRLLALQLGRPVAIHEEDYSVNLPSEVREAAAIFDEEASPSLSENAPSSLSYFISVIKFSRILGRVIRDLYRPSQVTVDPDRMLLSTATLDEKLLEWKLSLPRHLRFDLGHTFEKSITFRRQRNMLAIKFHHLRTLMHRPYLCLTWLQRHNRSLMALLERARDRVNALEKICIFEAQQTAHLLHNVADERSLVHDFPWWQMISCLLCASSVLLVAHSCVDPNQSDAKLQSQALDEDAETCLKVFDALSVNSEAARRAKDMMKELKRTRILPRSHEQHYLRFLYSIANEKLDTFLSEPNCSIVDEQSAEDGSTMPFVDRSVYNTVSQSSGYTLRQDISEWYMWPGELSDPMSWSAQFIDPSQNLHFNAVTMSDDEIPMFPEET